MEKFSVGELIKIAQISYSKLRKELYNHKKSKISIPKKKFEPSAFNTFLKTQHPEMDHKQRLAEMEVLHQIS